MNGPEGESGGISSALLLLKLFSRLIVKECDIAVKRDEHIEA